MTGNVKLNAEVTIEELCDIIEKSEVISSVDVGSAVIHKVRHETLGFLVLVSTASGTSAVLDMTDLTS